MAFKPVNLILQSVLPLATQPQNLPRRWAYLTADDTTSGVATSGYFNIDPNQLLQNVNFNVGDQIYCVCTNGNVLLTLTAVGVTGTTTIAASVSAGSVDTNAIIDGAVTLSKLATAISPSHVIKFAGQKTTVGGAAAEAFTVTGAVAATDIAFVQVVNDGTNNRTALQAVVTNNTLTVTFSGDPGADLVFNYQIIRATS